MLIDIHRRSPFRAPAWRWIRAATRNGDCPRAARHDDDWVRRACRFRAALDRSGDDDGHPRVAGADPTVLAAYRVHLGGPRARWEVEARLLAGQDDAAISIKTGIPAEAIEAFEAIFYSVRDRLEARDWVGAMVLGPRLYRGLEKGDVELAWKVVGYNLGPFVLEALIGSPGGALTDLSTVARADTSMSTADPLRTALAALTLPVNDETAPKLIRLAARLRQVEHESASRASAAVFAPVRMVGDAPSGFNAPIETKSKEPPRVPVAFVGGEGVDGRDEDDRLPVTSAPLVFQSPAVEITTTRRETA